MQCLVAPDALSPYRDDVPSYRVAGLRRDGLMSEKRARQTLEHVTKTRDSGVAPLGLTTVSRYPSYPARWDTS